MLTLTEISKRFGSHQGLYKTSLEIQSGEFLCILGPSGCGKTTLLRIMAGLEIPDTGKIILHNEDITSKPPHKRAIHTVFQRYALFPHMNVFDNIAFGLRCHKQSEIHIQDRVFEMLHLANLKGFEHRSIATLSGGEQQRVALIRALVNMPKVLLLDEPLAALDQKLRLQLQQDLVQLQRKVKTTFIFVTHDQQEALNMSDRLVVMNHGKVEQVGTPIEIYESPKTSFVARFVGTMNRLTEKWSNRAGEYGVRPEKLSLHLKPQSSFDIQLEATLTSQVYLGTHTQFELKLPDGTCLQVFQQNGNRKNQREFSNGQKVYVGCKESALIRLDDNL